MFFHIKAQRLTLRNALIHFVTFDLPVHKLTPLKKKTIARVATRPIQAIIGWKNAKWLALLERLNLAKAPSRFDSCCLSLQFILADFEVRFQHREKENTLCNSI